MPAPPSSTLTPWKAAPQTSPPPTGLRLFVLTALALVAFAANSLLCRAAFAEGHLGGDPATFTAVRLLAGAMTLGVIRWVRDRRRGESLATAKAGSWLSAGMLFVYAVAFSWAYVLLPTGSGALILFGAVQLTMLTAGLVAGERLRRGQAVGLIAAFVGLVTLLWPGLAAPPLAGAIPMIAAGVAWGLYSLRGRGAQDAVAETAGNFARAAPLTLLLLGGLWAYHGPLSLDATSLLYATLSGALASGLGYVVWFAALRGLTATRAAIVQLAVPILAALGGIVFLGEALTLRLCVAGLLVFGGITLGVERHHVR